MPVTYQNHAVLMLFVAKELRVAVLRAFLLLVTKSYIRRFRR